VDALFDLTAKGDRQEKEKQKDKGKQKQKEKDKEEATRGRKQIKMESYRVLALDDRRDALLLKDHHSEAGQHQQALLILLLGLKKCQRKEVERNGGRETLSAANSTWVMNFGSSFTSFFATNSRRNSKIKQI